MCLNPSKCSFRVHACKFMDLMLVKEGIEENIDKFQTIIDMKSPTKLRKSSIL